MGAWFLACLNNDLLGLVGVRHVVVVVGTPVGQVLNLIPVGCLVVTSDQTYCCGVICERDDPDGDVCTPQGSVSYQI